MRLVSQEHQVSLDNQVRRVKEEPQDHRDSLEHQEVKAHQGVLGNLDHAVTLVLKDSLGPRGPKGQLVLKELRVKLECKVQLARQDSPDLVDRLELKDHKVIPEELDLRAIQAARDQRDLQEVTEVLVLMDHLEILEILGLKEVKGLLDQRDLKDSPDSLAIKDFKDLLELPVQLELRDYQDQVDLVDSREQLGLLASLVALVQRVAPDQLAQLV